MCLPLDISLYSGKKTIFSNTASFYAIVAIKLHRQQKDLLKVRK